jgi:hypothetical protein
LVGKPERRRTLGRTEDNTGMDLKYNQRVWTGFTRLRIGTSEYGNQPSGSIKGQEFLTELTISFSRS